LARRRRRNSPDSSSRKSQSCYPVAAIPLARRDLPRVACAWQAHGRVVPKALPRCPQVSTKAWRYLRSAGGVEHPVSNQPSDFVRSDGGDRSSERHELPPCGETWIPLSGALAKGRDDCVSRASVTRNSSPSRIAPWMDAVSLQEAAGLEIVTDGEMRRARRGTRRQSALIACATLGPYPPANC